MEGMRKPLQGVTNIVRFNWHYYLLAILLVLTTIFANSYFNSRYILLLNIVATLALTTTLISLLVSMYIYDLSGLYSFSCLDALPIKMNGSIVNIHAGFDETSNILSAKYPNATISIFDFYDPVKHTEVSIKRARKLYPNNKETTAINTVQVPMADNSADAIFLIFAAHEIRNEQERVVFFQELRRVLRHNGRIVIMEHQRDLPNFLAYNIGFFHFLSRSTWLNLFDITGLKIEQKIKITPFITTYILIKNDTEH